MLRLAQRIRFAAVDLWARTAATFGCTMSPRGSRLLSIWGRQSRCRPWRRVGGCTQGQSSLIQGPSTGHPYMRHRKFGCSPVGNSRQRCMWSAWVALDKRGIRSHTAGTNSFNPSVESPVRSVNGAHTRRDVEVAMGDLCDRFLPTDCSVRRGDRSTL